jgi:hypothetical protein
MILQVPSSETARQRNDDTDHQNQTDTTAPVNGSSKIKPAATEQQ